MYDLCFDCADWRHVLGESDKIDALEVIMGKCKHENIELFFSLSLSRAFALRLLFTGYCLVYC